MTRILKTGWRPVVLTMLMSVLLGLPRPAAADPITFATFFAGLRDTMRQSILDARNAGDAIAIQAGRQTLLAIAQAEASYKRSMEKTFDSLDAKTRKNLDSLKTTVGQVSKRTYTQVSDITARLETIVQQLPFRKYEPKVRSVSPNFVAPTPTSSDVGIKVAGAFEHSARPGFEPSTTEVDGKTSWVVPC